MADSRKSLVDAIQNNPTRLDMETAPLTVVSARMREQLSSLIGEPATPEVMEKIKTSTSRFLARVAKERYNRDGCYIINGRAVKVYIKDGQIFIDTTTALPLNGEA